MKKSLFVSALFFAAFITPLFALEEEQITDEVTFEISTDNTEADESETDETAQPKDVLLKLNLSDCLFSNVLCFGNSTDLSFDTMFLKNRLGFGIGATFKECFSEDFDFAFYWAPYISFNFFGAKLYGGVMPTFDAGAIGFDNPYFGCSYTFDFGTPPEVANIYGNWGLTCGAEWFAADIGLEEDATALYFFFQVLLPKFFVGVTYRTNFKY